MRYSAGAACVLFFRFASAQTTLSVLPLDSSIRDVSMFGPTDPSFIAYFTSRIQPAEMPAFQPILPYSVVIRNGSDKAILGFCLQFDTVDSKGTPLPFAQCRGYRAEDVAVTPGAETWIAVDSVYSFMFDAPADSKTRAAFIAGTRFPAQHPPEFYRSAKSVQVSLDSVLFADGTLEGPDRRETAVRFASDLGADIALAQAVLSFKNDSAGLQQFVRMQATLGPSGLDETKREMRRRSSLIARTLKKEGTDAAMAAASRLYNAASVVKIHRAD
jgi:hypothetical protein